MENMVELENNLKLLLAEISILDQMKDHVIQKRNRKMELWVQTVAEKMYEVSEIENVFKDQKKKGFPPKNLDIRVQLSYSVIQTLKEVKVLIEKGKLSANSIDHLMRELAFEKPSRYSYDDIKKFTSDFATRIGSGGFGDVYLGRISETVEIAAKVLKMNVVHETSEKMFAAEVRIMGKTCHPNLIKLYGFCLDGDKKIVVYEYMKNGSLDTILYNRPLSVEWVKLYEIAIEIGKALSYLHDGCTFQIVHHDVKAANVLLDEEYSAKVTDFGLANLMAKNQTHQTLMKAQGTSGYAAPEIWSRFSPVTYKCDVYGFGMLLLEILGNRSIIDGTSYFPEMVWQKFEENSLDQSFVAYGIPEKDRQKAKVLVMVALWCIQHTPGTRPSMDTVVAVLEKEIIVNSPPDPFYISNPLESIMQPVVTYSDLFTSSDNVSITRQQLPQGRTMSQEENEDLINSLDFGGAKRYSRDNVSITEQQLPQGRTMSQEEIEDLIKRLDFGDAKRYSPNDLVNFTSNFCKMIGFGAYGKVYGGRFANDVEVAVKVLEMNDIAGESFVAEVRTVAKTYHHNIVKLYGFCIEGNTKALVYEYVENGSLDKILYTNPIKMEWEKLYSIAIDTAKALAYLHDDCEKQIIHYDVKPANILLDRNQSPKLTDFGLANLFENGETHLTMTRVRGTRGYMAPEAYSQFAPLTFKCDVYSFGMLLFEILRRDKNYKTSKPFPKTVWDMFVKGNLKNVIEECGISEKDREKAKVLCMVALWCAQFTPEARPSMKAVVTALEKEILVNSPPDPNYPSDSLAKMTLEQTSPEEISSSNESERTRKPQDVKKNNQLDNQLRRCLSI